jgi:Glycosyl hydrolase family 20, catalytic domain/Glycosyl hydrolase family 20, domain 2
MNIDYILRRLVSVALLILLCSGVRSSDDGKPLIFPLPTDTQVKGGIFEIDHTVFIMVPAEASEADKFHANFILTEFVDKYEVPVAIQKRSSYTFSDKFILAGDTLNQLVRKFCRENGLSGKLWKLGPEGYILSVTANNVVVAANTDKGTLYGLESLRQIIGRRNGTPFIPQLLVTDSPAFPFRGIKLYLPGRENIAFFKRFIKDFAALYKFNKIILELNANMRLDKHPELNIGAIEFARYLNQSRLDRPAGIHMEFQNSSHQDNADGGILEKEEVADLVSYIRKFNIEIIPELPSLTHSYYLLAGHRELAENLAQPYPDTYCPLKPEIYNIYFDVLDEYIDVIHPSTVHIGHDEWRMEKNLCELCRGKDYGQLYADDVIKIHDYLSGKGIRTALWGDHLLESVTHKDHQEWESSTGYKYNIPGALTPEQVLKLIPKDVLVFNWFWNDKKNDRQVSYFGFDQVYGNFTPDITDWEERITTKGLLGGAPSSWAASTEVNFGKDLIYDFLGCANLLWSEHYKSPYELSFLTQEMMNEIRDNFRGELAPSAAGSTIIPVNISAKTNSSLEKGIDSIYGAGLISGQVKSGNILFNLNNSGGAGKAVSVSSSKTEKGNRAVSGIEINRDVNSIIFLHACAQPGKNEKAYRMIYEQIGTAQLLGWYEVIYEDGFIETIPVRYGVNILDWGWKQRMLLPAKDEDADNQRYVYEADAIEVSSDPEKPVTFFSYEWKNNRPGKRIKSIGLKAADAGKKENAIILLAINITETQVVARAEGNEN